MVTFGDASATSSSADYYSPYDEVMLAPAAPRRPPDPLPSDPLLESIAIAYRELASWLDREAKPALIACALMLALLIASAVVLGLEALM